MTTRINKLRNDKKRVEFYLDETQIDYSKIKMFALDHQVSISKLFTDAIDFFTNDAQFYPMGGYKNDKNE